MSEINKAMVAIAREIAAEGIGKTRKNTQQGYNFRGVDEVMNAFAPVLAKHGVVVVPEFSGWQMSERTSSKGGALFDVLVAGKFTFTHEDGSSITAGPFYGEAMDSADKATNKAMAVAFKYAMFQTFCVPLEGVTGGDADETTHEVDSTTEAQIAEWIEAFKGCDTEKSISSVLDELGACGLPEAARQRVYIAAIGATQKEPVLDLIAQKLKHSGLPESLLRKVRAAWSTQKNAVTKKAA